MVVTAPADTAAGWFKIETTPETCPVAGYTCN
jgi:hypothetical protein